jgi:hypothetical protein
MKRFPNCEQLKTDPKIVLQENQSKITLENPQRQKICLLEVDDCAITAGVRCDYALTASTIEEEFYIELKGRDVKHAVNQIEATIQQISANPTKHPKICFVISTRCPLSGQDIQKLQLKMKRAFNARLEFHKLQFAYKLNE